MPDIQADSRGTIYDVERHGEWAGDDDATKIDPAMKIH